MTRDRAFEILGSYGADAARWPADERAALLALAAADAEVAAALAAEQRLDAALSGWARDVPERRFDADALLPAPVVRGGGRFGVMRWVAGGAVAAALALVVVTLPGGGGREIAAVEEPVVMALTAQEAEDLEGFAMFFTPTADEEDVI